ncbi:MAG: Slp family lipoprotein [Nitrospira sp.]
MRTLGFFIACVSLAACTTPPLFPPEITKSVETDTFDIKAWKDQAYHLSDATFVPHKVKLAGEIIRVIRKPKGIVILAEEQPLDAHPASGPAHVEQDGSLWFAITFKGVVDSRMLQAGNRVTVIGTTTRADAEMLGGAPRVLPHLAAQCLHIWNTEGAKNKYYYSSGFARPYPPEEQTFCREESIGSLMSPGDPGEEKRDSAGS